mmetsp:Transcript_8446/g.23663  ORF Transcript_8446/g.23663 Transcript_8446/m.23663 type:complete len:201 (-) Transcript_8446:1740-2342(-)
MTTTSSPSMDRPTSPSRRTSTSVTNRTVGTSRPSAMWPMASTISGRPSRPPRPLPTSPPSSRFVPPSATVPPPRRARAPPTVLPSAPTNWPSPRRPTVSTPISPSRSTPTSRRYTPFGPRQSRPRRPSGTPSLPSTRPLIPPRPPRSSVGSIVRLVPKPWTSSRRLWPVRTRIWPPANTASSASMRWPATFPSSWADRPI